jgi:hypothetical protein
MLRMASVPQGDTQTKAPNVAASDQTTRDREDDPSVPVPTNEEVLQGFPRT